VVHVEHNVPVDNVLAKGRLVCLFDVLGLEVDGVEATAGGYVVSCVGVEALPSVIRT